MLSASSEHILTCPVSGSTDCIPFLEIHGMPVLCNVLYDSRDEAVGVARGDLSLVFCRESGHVFNASFDSELITYAPNYENSLHFSQTFQDFADKLADHLIEDYGIRNKRVIDIGCGRGDFLQALCDRGNNTGIGFDPSFQTSSDQAVKSKSFHVIPDLYSEKYSDTPADLVCCRHVLEHIERPLDFVQTVRKAIGNNRDAVVYFEVPNLLFILRDLAIWDLIYEHVSYFSTCSLEWLFRSSGFTVQDTYPAYGGQFLGIESSLTGDSDTQREAASRAVSSGLSESDTPEAIGELVANFSREYHEKVGRWSRIVDSLRASGKQAVIWGAGSKGVTILNILQAADVIRYAVDINPRKHGKFVAGSGQQIVGPDALVELRPDTVLLMNSIYEEEVRGTLNEIGGAAELFVDQLV